MSLNIAVVCGSVRQGQQSIKVANYISQQIDSLGHESVLVDFTKIVLPFVDTPVAPGDLHGNYPYETVKQWSGIAATADAFILVAPEYNHGYSAVLKNGLDWLYSEFAYKPVGLVGVSNGMVGGARAIEQLRELCGGFGMYDIKETVMFRQVQNVFADDNSLLDTSYQKPVATLITQLSKIAESMKTLR